MTSNVFDISKFQKTQNRTRYLHRIQTLKNKNLDTESIELAVEKASKNIQGGSRSFVIYGEPQSGKTEMMIALTARVLDDGFKIVVILLNDSVQLLNQNLERFQRSGLDPAPKNFAELLDSSVVIGANEWVIFCKKNSKDLQKLNNKIASYQNKVVIDDEADYATPNSKVNKGEETKINELVRKLLGNSGIYIGVTATPARLDLNNTFGNENEKWVDFFPHAAYTGQDIFFPTSTGEMHNLKYYLTLLPDNDDNPKYLRAALAKFFVNAAFLNLEINDKDENYSMLVHTSGKKVDHTEDYKQIIKVFNILNNSDNPKYEYMTKLIWEYAKEKYPGYEDRITQYILDNISKYNIVVMNSDVDKKVVDFASATNPSTLFTIAIGGNIVSRGVTFDNLISMFFTRDSKHKIQQDTYIQRARMFGSRGAYLRYFELSIPESLYLDWQRCFVFHKLSLSAIKSGLGSPIWLEDRRISSVARASIDKTNVDMDRGQMFFDMFDYASKLNSIIDDSSKGTIDKLEEIHTIFGEKVLPKYLLNFVKNFSPQGETSIALYPVREVERSQKHHDTLIRTTEGGIFSGSDRDKFPEANHFFLVLRNEDNKSRVVYRYLGNIGGIKTISKKTKVKS